ncbi:oxidoreductase [Streptomyces eurocidicus]|uniref:Oxidoreductase n=1 Tax=Streptomyces eurocidicus TaxID=66423 RepID=A0A2N8NXV6_STREU|nr:Gfo/Idh/MocA family oxidoreductase [Streptomyces eurocidicus]MBB5123028.1 putative dehydrogenase [Streptomyces eurocidicus]MBF6053821.1 gfo/Idh/MocA family oxidoreductase [Streptomyces eurocidicus]PNE33601.1 oxidoreductase [Streptomyces eurocidicus]
MAPLTTGHEPGTGRTDPVRIGVLGCADIARRRMLPAMTASPDVEVVAVAGRDHAKAGVTAAEFGCRATHGYEALLADPDVEAVYVPLPAALHAVWVEEALRAGKHVLAEKPLTTDLARTEHLVGLARETGRVLRENVMFVHHPQHATVRRLVLEGAIGEPRVFQAAFAVPRLPEHDIRYRPELGGGALWDTGVYPVRAALHFLGAGLEVEGAVLVHGPGRAVDTSGTALLRSPDGVAAHLTFGLDHAYRSSYEIWGSEGRISVDRAFTPPADHVPHVRVERRSGTEELRLPPADQVLRAVTAFAAAVRTGGAPDLASVHQAGLLDDVRRRASAPLAWSGDTRLRAG